MQTQIVKRKDVAQYPSKFKAMKMAAKGLEGAGKAYSRQLDSGRNVGQLASQELRDFIAEKKELTDHQGFVLSATGTRLTAIAKAAITEEQLERMKAK